MLEPRRWQDRSLTFPTSRPARAPGVRAEIVRTACRALVALSVLAVPGCLNDDAPDLTTSSGIVTVAAPGQDFSLFKTFSVPDAITEIQTDAALQAVYSCNSSPAAQQILAAVVNAMTARGYVLGPVVHCQDATPNAPDADLAVNLAITLTPFSETDFYPCYWWSWWGFPDHGCSPGWDFSASYSAGMLVIQFSDLRSRPPPASIADVWGAFGYAVLSANELTDVSTAIAAVNTAFSQSPYLRTQ
jgi:hypothetical protein